MSKLTKYKRQKREYKYYSFLNGLPNDPATLWTLDDVRLPAENMKHALRVYRILTQSKLRSLKTTFDFKYPPPYVRRVVEFEKVKEHGLTVWQFKHIQDFTVV